MGLSRCAGCKFRMTVAQEGFWLHVHRDLSISKGDYFTLLGRAPEGIGPQCNKHKGKNPEDVFNDRDVHCKKRQGNDLNLNADSSLYTSFSKPRGVLWFSQGSWLTDPCNDLSHEYHKIYGNNKVIAVKEVVNVLHVKTLQDFENFVKSYPRGKYHIDWDKIREDGYYGVAFHFKRVHELGIPHEEALVKYTWHYSFDVESMCIWDRRAFAGKLYPCKVVL